MEHDWVAIGMAVAAIVLSFVSMILTVLAMERAEKNRRS